MTRSRWKFKFIHPTLHYQIHRYKENFFSSENSVVLKKKLSIPSFEVWYRSSIISSDFLNSVVEVHNGAKFISFRIEPQQLNHKFGEFAYTKKLGPTIHIFGKKKHK